VVRNRVRIRFSKQGDLRLIGHRDLMRCFERMFRRAGLALAFSQGFHPKPRMTFPLALAVGIVGIEEVMEGELAAGKGDGPRPTFGRRPPERPEECFAPSKTAPFSDAESLARRLAPQAPAGLRIGAVELLPEGAPKARVRSVSYDVPIPPPYRAGLPERIERLLAAASHPIERARGRAPIDLRPLLAELILRGDALHMRLLVSRLGSVGPREVLAALDLPDLEPLGVRLRRTAVEIGP